MKKNKEKLDVWETIATFPKKHKQGFTWKEEKSLRKMLKHKGLKLHQDKYESALRGITGMLIDGDQIVYPVDIYHAVKAAIENRELYSFEWD